MPSISTDDLADFANALVCGQADQLVLILHAVNLLADELPNVPNGWRASTTLLDVQEDIGTLASTLDGLVVKVLALFHNGRELSHESTASLDASLGPAWHDLRGPPRYWTTDREHDRQVRIVPQPTIAAGDLNHVVVFALMADPVLPLYLRLPAALWILSREYSRESAYRDMDFAKICQSISERMFSLVEGVVVDPNAKKQAQG